MNGLLVVVSAAALIIHKSLSGTVLTWKMGRSKTGSRWEDTEAILLETEEMMALEGVGPGFGDLDNKTDVR